LIHRVVNVEREEGIYRIDKRRALLLNGQQFQTANRVRRMLLHRKKLWNTSCFGGFAVSNDFYIEEMEILHMIVNLSIRRIRSLNLLVILKFLGVVELVSFMNNSSSLNESRKYMYIQVKKKPDTA